MNEWQILGIGILKLIGIVIAASLYSVGGRTMKWIRRFVTPLVICGVTYGLSFMYDNLWLIGAIVLTYGLLALGYVQGYGGDTQGEKFLKRLKCGLMITLAGLPVAIIGGAWILFGMQVVIGTSVMIILGMFNPKSAAVEELLIGFMTAIFVPYYL